MYAFIVPDGDGGWLMGETEDGDRLGRFTANGEYDGDWSFNHEDFDHTRVIVQSGYEGPGLIVWFKDAKRKGLYRGYKSNKQGLDTSEIKKQNQKK